MGNLYSKLFLAAESVRTYAKFAFVLAMLIGYAIALVPSAQSLTQNVIKPICQIYAAVHTAVFVLGLTLLVLGAALYAGGNIAPGNLKGTIQGYGMGMIVGGIAGVILAMLAPYMLNIITGLTANSVTSTCPPGSLS